MRVLLPTLLLVGACGAPEVSDDPCRQGYSRAADGHCYPPRTEPAPPDATAVIDAMEPCVPRDADGVVDLVTGCAGEACPGATYADLELALGPGVCEASSSRLYCDFAPGIQARFDDADEDGLPDEEATTPWIRLYPEYPHATADGLGAGTSPRCWTSALGTPSDVWFVDRAGALALDGMAWDQYGLEIHDWEGDDGLVDNVYLLGPP